MKRLILVGRGGSGKDFARKILQRGGWQFQPSYTTRPARSEEKHGKDYFFISEKDFKHKIQQNEWYEYQYSNGWYYGRLKSQFDSGFVQKQMFIMTPKEISSLLSPKERMNSLIVYFNIKESKLIQERLLGRGWTQEQVKKRTLDDNQDFESFVLTQPGVEISDAFFTEESLRKIIQDVEERQSLLVCQRPLMTIDLDPLIMHFLSVQNDLQKDSPDICDDLCDTRDTRDIRDIGDKRDTRDTFDIPDTRRRDIHIEEGLKTKITKEIQALTQKHRVILLSSHAWVETWMRSCLLGDFVEQFLLYQSPDDKEAVLDQLKIKYDITFHVIKKKKSLLLK